MSDYKANRIEVEVNQQAYNTDGLGDKQVYAGGANTVSLNQNGDIKLGDTLGDVLDGTELDTLIRTDVDIHEGYQIPQLQNQEKGSNNYGYLGSSLNITAYNVYEGDGVGNTKPISVCVGVAGSQGSRDLIKASPDWKQNYDIFLNRSAYNGKTDEQLQNKLKYADKMTRVKIKYELEIREKVKALKHYREDHIPITIVGDSKGAEDAAYLGLSFVKSTMPISGLQTDLDYRAADLYFVNPKGVRLSTQDYEILKRIAEAGFITVEIVYPEIVSDGLLKDGKLRVDGSGVADGRVIPCRPDHKFYTVPTSVANPEVNHQVTSYDTNVYQGFDGKSKFQGNSKPESITGYKGLTKQTVGYRYTIDRISKKNGTTISVNTYFFEEQKAHLLRMNDQVQTDILFLKQILKEDYERLFYDNVINNKYALKLKHKQLIQRFTSEEDYIHDHIMRTKPSVVDLVAQKAMLRREYEYKLDQYIDEEAEKYHLVIIAGVKQEIEIFMQFVYDEIMRLQRYADMLMMKLDDIGRLAQVYQLAHEEIKMTITKMKTI